MGEQLHRSEEQLTRAITARASLDQTNWMVFSAFWGANAVLLIALVQSKDNWIVPASGLLMSVVWFQIQRRVLGHLTYLEKVVQSLEESLQVSVEHAISGWLNRAAYEACMPRPKGLRTRGLMIWSVAAVTLAWAFLLVAKALHWG
jgi:hypothetical protein